jgi:hypothetical protein
MVSEAQEIWSEAKGRAINLHNEGLSTAFDIALQDRRVRNNPALRHDIRLLYVNEAGQVTESVSHLPDRKRIAQAILLTREHWTENVIVLDTCEDAVYMIVRLVNEKRHKNPDIRGEFLKQCVKGVIHYFCFDSGRERLYELVVMKYYNLGSQLVAKTKARNPWKQRTRKPKSKKGPASEFTLVG